MIKDIKEELRQRHLKNLITEAVVLALYEQDQMQIPAIPPAAGAPPTAAETQPQIPPDAQVPPQATAPQQQLVAEQITLDLLIERLNIIRGGKSFTDPEVYGQMTSFIKSLSEQEKQTVYKFLMQTSKVVTSNAQQTYGEEQQQQQEPNPQASTTQAPPPPPAPPAQQAAPAAPPQATAPITPTQSTGGF